MADIDKAIAERAAPQLGLITRQQCHDLGATKHMIASRLRNGTLEPRGTRVLRVAGAPTSWRQDVLGACLEGEAVASHRAAARLWRLDGMRQAPVEVTVRRGRRPRQVDGILHSARDLPAVDVGVVGPVPVTTPARTLIDCAAVVPPPALECMLDGALRDGLVRESYLRWRIGVLRTNGRPGIAAIEAALRPPATGNGRRPHSWLERAVLSVIATAGLPPPRVQVHLRANGRVARVDLFYDEQRLVVEVAGHRTHSTRRDRQADAERANRLRLAGHGYVEFTYEDVVERADYVTATIAAALGLPARAA